MELKLIKRSKFGEEDFYCVYIGNDYIKGSYDIEKAQSYYNELKNNPDALAEKTEVIESILINPKND